MKIGVQFFAQLRDVAGVSGTELDLPAGATVADLLRALYAGRSALAEWDPHIRTAVGVEYVGRESALRDGDVVAVMPPVQGG